MLCTAYHTYRFYWSYSPVCTAGFFFCLVIQHLCKVNSWYKFLIPSCDETTVNYNIVKCMTNNAGKKKKKSNAITHSVLMSLPN